MGAKLRIAGALGEDVTVATERSSRDFAAGDRIMFLKNERSLGVRNGTLGTVSSASQVRLAVQLDDGRSVDFDIKDYAQIDHGHAATIHKAQGRRVCTVSRDRAKDTASDYAREPERQFAERRGITFRERIAELVRQLPEKVRGMFDSLRLPVAIPKWT